MAPNILKVGTMLLTDLQTCLEEYRFVKVTEAITDDVFDLMRRNEYFISRTLPQGVTREECEQDIHALPPGTDISQKYYFALYREDECAALLDYIEGYPSASIVFIGLFILDPKFQGTGAGAHIMSKFISCAKNSGFKEIRLGCFETNEAGLVFWSRMGFIKQKFSVREAGGKNLNLIEMGKAL